MGATENLSSSQFSTTVSSNNGTGASKPNGQSASQATRLPQTSTTQPLGGTAGQAGNNTLPRRKAGS